MDAHAMVSRLQAKGGEREQVLGELYADKVGSVTSRRTSTTVHLRKKLVAGDVGTQRLPAGDPGLHEHPRVRGHARRDRGDIPHGGTLPDGEALTA
jgi:hypothetical protein